MMLVPQPVYADSLTSLFQTQAFSGSLSTISKLNWVGWLLSGIISVFCLIGLFLTVFRIMATLMVLSGKNIFLKIHEIKSSGSGGVIGVKDTFMTALKGGGTSGSGVDAIIYFLLGLAPDVLMYSDIAEGMEAPGITQDTTTVEYILKTSIPTILMIFFLSIGFSGTLWQMFGTCVDAMVVAADRVATTNLESSVKRLLDADSYYQFGFGDDGSKWGNLKENMAKSIYNKVLSHSDGSIDGDNSLLLGQIIGEMFTGKSKTADLTSNGIAKACGNENYAKDEFEAENVKYNVVVNTISDSSDDGQHDIVIPFKSLAQSMQSSSSNKLNVGFADKYIHVYIYRKESAVEVNYFSAKSKKSDSSENGTFMDQKLSE